MPAAPASNKAKIARRVVEVLEFFDEGNPEATVMDIVRRYDRPQSSTSELLSCLVELGLLSKDPHSRSYRPTPRAALLGTGGQNEAVRDGRIVRLMDRLVAQTGLSVALFGIVGLNAQIVSWRRGARDSGRSGLYGGLQVPLSQSTAGTLLLATMPRQRRDGVLRRLNSEAPEAQKFSTSEAATKVEACQSAGHVRGPVGFGSRAEVLARLLPELDERHPLAVGFVYPPSDAVAVKAEALLACLDEAIAHAVLGEGPRPARIELVPAAVA